MAWNIHLDQLSHFCPLPSPCAPSLPSSLPGRAVHKAAMPLTLCSAAQQQLKLAWALPTTHMNKSHIANPGSNSCISASRSGEGWSRQLKAIQDLVPQEVDDASVLTLRASNCTMGQGRGLGTDTTALVSEAVVQSDPSPVLPIPGSWLSQDAAERGDLHYPALLFTSYAAFCFCKPLSPALCWIPRNLC